ncbi:hypothetical protein Ae356Ps1_6056c [Pseudonocardia sp. Ae356_Ps1]|nr:hypothetical protein Ae356Ps1_6048c [Pseudonocardia sp. Ae356_Ps1]OLL89312.1 hypothetical protein Ae356Ps1_6056c [Pseudonocardia sp. Ae356_Ps1]
MINSTSGPIAGGLVSGPLSRPMWLEELHSTAL